MQLDLFPETLGYPDINSVDDLVSAVANMPVLGGYSRSFSYDPLTGETEADRYIEKLSDYISESKIREFFEKALEWSQT